MNMAFADRNLGQVQEIIPYLKVGVKAALSPEPVEYLMTAEVTMASVKFASLIAAAAGAGSFVPVVGIVVGAIIGTLLSFLGKSQAKRKAEAAAWAAKYRAYVENATRVLQALGYKWTEDDLSEYDIYEFQVAMQTKDSATIASWMESKGLDPARLIPDWPHIQPSRASDPERFLTLTQVLLISGYNKDMIDRIEYLPDNVFPFSDFYELLHGLKPKGDETNYAIYRFIIYLEEHWFDPYVLFPTLKALPSIYVEGNYYLVVDEPSPVQTQSYYLLVDDELPVVTGQSQVTKIPVTEPELLASTVLSKIEVQQAGVSPLLWIPLIGIVVAGFLQHGGSRGILK